MKNENENTSRTNQIKNRKNFFFLTAKKLPDLILV